MSWFGVSKERVPVAAPNHATQNRPDVVGRRESVVDIGTLLLVFVGIVLLFVLIDLLVVGGAMTAGMMGGMMMVAATPIGLLVFLILLALGALFVYAQFFA